MTLRRLSKSNICNCILPSKVVNQHTNFEEKNFILSQVTIQKPTRIKNKLSESVILKNKSRSTMYQCILAFKVVKQHASLTMLAVFFIRLLSGNQLELIFFMKGLKSPPAGLSLDTAIFSLKVIVVLHKRKLLLCDLIQTMCLPILAKTFVFTPCLLYRSN